MELISARLNSERRGRDPKDKRKIHFIRVNATEAHRLIQSLSAQLVSGNPNTGRLEFECKNGDELTVAVHPDITAERHQIQGVVDRLLAPIERRWQERFEHNDHAGIAELEKVISTIRTTCSEILPRDYLAEEEAGAAKQKARKKKHAKDVL